MLQMGVRQAAESIHRTDPGERAAIDQLFKDDLYGRLSGCIPINVYPKMKLHTAQDHRLAHSKSVKFHELSDETFILYPKMLEDCTRELQRQILDRSGIPYQIYAESCSPFFSDLLVPIGKGIRLWNWSDRLAPNTTLLTIDDTGYETTMFLLYNPESANQTIFHFIEAFMQYRRNRL